MNIRNHEFARGFLAIFLAASVLTGVFFVQTYNAAATTQAMGTLSLSILGSGTVSDGTDSCFANSSCNKAYPIGSSVALTVQPASGFVFSGWGGACASFGTSTTCSGPITSDTSVYASFNPAVPPPPPPNPAPTPSQSTLTLTLSGNGSVSDGTDSCSVASCSKNYTTGTVVTLRAAPAAGFTFSSWGGACASSGTSTTCSGPINSNSAVSAVFTANTNPTTPVPPPPPSAMSSLTVNVSAGGTVSDGSAICIANASCNKTYTTGSTLTLTASPVSGYTFSGWGGTCATAGTNPICSGPINSNQTVSASFSTITNPTTPLPAPSSLSISTSSPLPDAVVGQFYTATFTAVGGSGSYGWTVSSGTPAGMFQSACTGNTCISSGTPTTAGIYNFSVTVVSGALSASKQFVLSVKPQAVNAAKYVSQAGPTNLCVGQTYTGSITMMNTGTTTWTYDSGYRLGSQNPQDNTTWGSGRTFVTGSVAPGQNFTFNFNFVAPRNEGRYNFQAKMLKEGVEWFGDYTPNAVMTVGRCASSPSSANDQQPLPSTQRHSRGSVVIDSGTVYFLGNELRYPFPSAEIFFSWGHSFSEIVQANSADLTMTIGPLATLKQ
jgi:hypothetical protein